MAKDKQLLAFDFGASSGRAMLGSFDGERIELTQVHRFNNDPVRIAGTLYWDVLRLLHETKQGLIESKKYGPMDSLGIDTWGVDFGLLDADGLLIENPVHYRDLRTQGVMEDVCRRIPRRELYERTGTQFMNINTIYQLYALQQKRPELLNRACHLLLMPDLLTYFLTGKKQSEYTMASTGQLLNARRGDWDWDIIDRLELPRHLFKPIVYPGKMGARLALDICEETGVEAMPTAVVASHDTASAVVAVPATTPDFVYISSGTWSLMGIESEQPFISEQAYRYNFTNEGGYGQTTRFLKNIMGLWLIQESRRHWNREGAKVSYADLEKEALASKPFRFLIDPDDESLVSPGDMPQRIRQLCRQSGQPVPQTRGEVMRCIYESLALKYKITKQQIESLTGKSYPDLHIVGGGTKDALLSQFTANATGCRVIAGPIEATALGNMAVQLLAQKSLATLAQARQVIASSFELQTYSPQDEDLWQKAAKQYAKLYPYLQA